MQRIEEEKRVQDRLILEVEEHESERSIRERAIKDELEQKRKANQEKWHREREFISKKYNILQSARQVEEEVSLQSLRSNRSTSSTVHRWLANQRRTATQDVVDNDEAPTTTAPYTRTIPRRTSAECNVITSKPDTATHTHFVAEHAHFANSDGNSLYSMAIGGVTSPLKHIPVTTTGFLTTVPNSGFVYEHAVTEKDLISPPTTKQSALSKAYSRISTVVYANEANLEEQVRDLKCQLEKLQVTSNLQSKANTASEIPSAYDPKEHGRVLHEGRCKQSAVTFASNLVEPHRFGDPLFNSTPATISYNSKVCGCSTGKSQVAPSTSVAKAN